jgi:CheY-like chemotaxis protein
MAEMSNNSERRILLVDDDDGIINLYSDVLQRFGFNFSIAKDGEEALEKVKNEKPSLILLDIMLPDVNGFEVLKRIKEDPDTKDITVWILSVLAEQENLNRAKSLGATEYLVKSSYTPRQVCEKIQGFLESS